jgi:hypothetical protein
MKKVEVEVEVKRGWGCWRWEAGREAAMASVDF